ncbi:CRISPR-associated protein Cas2 [Agrobacterium tumefaciens]|uniref:CRISPR-associated protein Cas2 n=1 Tax=Agrobacterium tumefaciens TaxID=358 RepID=UPI0021CF09FC|nr:CRISPR-associated protein Cas2 [Agrobacterium tumefaciens]UXT64143.1 CRISPR-associated protein Cas2 [Agrobacterium tumefaciens]
MPPFIVTYDLVKEESSDAYRPLIDDLKKRGAQRYQASCWLVSLDNTAEEVYDHYNAMLDDNDKLMVSELTWNHKQARNFKGTNDWIKNNPPVR